MEIPITESLAKLNEKIQAACALSGRNPAEIQLCAVTKTVRAERIQEAYACGLRHFGENYWQEAKEKVRVFSPPDAQWHFIGRLQTNKIKFLVPAFHVLQTVCSEEQAREISRHAKRVGKIQECFIQVNATEDGARAGINYRQTLDFIGRVSREENLKITGLMTMAPVAEKSETVRPVFKRMKTLFDGIARENISGAEMKVLSMGMSQDFEVAVQEGATLLRVGAAVFGARQKILKNEL